MTTTDPQAARYYAAYVATASPSHRGTAWCWSASYASAKEATAELKRRLDAGEASFGAIVEAIGARRRVLPHSVKPRSAARIVDHMTELLEQVRQPRE